MNQLLSRVQTWCGVRTIEEQGICQIILRDRQIARFPNENSFEGVLCGTLRRQIETDPYELPDGVWPHNNNDTILIDLTQPGGIEEAVRILLNAYVISESPASRDWWMKNDILKRDPLAKKTAEVIKQHRAALAARGNTSDIA